MEIFMIVMMVAMIFAVLLMPTPDMPSAKAPSMSDFDVTTATQDRVVPEVFGVVRIAPNIIDFKNFVAETIYFVPSGKGDVQEVGFAIYADSHFVLARRIDGLRKVYLNDIEVKKLDYSEGYFTYTNITQSTREFEISTGKKGDMYPSDAPLSIVNVNGGNFNNDVFNYDVIDSLEEVHTINHKLAQVKSEKMFLGDNSQAMPNYNFTCYRSYLYTTQDEIDGVLLPGNMSNLDHGLEDPLGDVNPYSVIRYIMNEHLDEDMSMVDGNSFQKLALENFYISFIMTAEHTAKDWLSEILRHIDGVLDYDLLLDKWSVNLIRGDYLDELDNEIKFLHSLNEDNYSGFKYERKTWENVRTKIVFKYTDPDNGKTAVMTFNNEAALLRTNKENTGTYEFMMIRNHDLAKLVMDRVIKKECYPLAVIKMKLPTSFLTDSNNNTTDKKIRIGTVLKISNDEFKMSNKYYRISSIGAGKETDDSFDIEMVEDIFAISDFDYTPSQENLSEDINYTLENIVEADFKFFDAPAELIPLGTDAVIPIILKNGVIENEQIRGVFIKDGLSGKRVAINDLYDRCELVAELGDESVTGKYNDEFTYIIQNYTGQARAAVEQGFQRLKFSMVFEDGEFATFKSISDNGDGTWTVTGIIRGLNNTNTNTKQIFSEIYISPVEAADVKSLTIAGYQDKTFYLQKYNSFVSTNKIAIPYTYGFTSRKPYNLELKESYLTDTDTKVYISWHEGVRQNGANYRPTEMVIAGENEGKIENGRSFIITVNGIEHISTEPFISLDRVGVETYRIKEVVDAIFSEELVVVL